MDLNGTGVGMPGGMVGGGMGQPTGMGAGGMGHVGMGMGGVDPMSMHARQTGLNTLIGAGAAAEDAENPFISEMDAQRHLQQMQMQLRQFWQEQLDEMDKLDIASEHGNPFHFKNHNDLPLARIKRIMKSDEDVRMISAEAPVLFAKACEMFILELTLRSWCYSEKNKRRTLQKEDIQTAIRKTEIFDFLVDVIQ